MSLTIGEALKEARNLLNKSATPDLDAQLLLAFILNKTRGFILAYRDQFLTGEQLTHFYQLLQQRSQQIPMAYLLGKKSFWTFELAITPDVLVPREETEILIEKVLEDYRLVQDLAVLDLGTGSGAIAIALAIENPTWEITALDINPNALGLAKKNANQLALTYHFHPISFVHSDWFETLTPFHQYDIIVSNPPYLAPDDSHLVDTEITHEPRLSLIAEANGLAAYHIIAANAKNFLHSEGRIYLEHGATQEKDIKNIFEEKGFKWINCYKDLAGNPRVSVFYNLSNN